MSTQRRVLSVNTFAEVPVPSSEHVAEIVGKKGYKILELRQKTDTYIKTPARGEPPVFLVSGRPENVEKAKQLILQASEEVSKLHDMDGRIKPVDTLTTFCPVPQPSVGFVVGSGGATVKHIQEATKTVIESPRGRSAEMLFKVTGPSENVADACARIQSLVKTHTRNARKGDVEFEGNGTVSVGGQDQPGCSPLAGNAFSRSIARPSNHKSGSPDVGSRSFGSAPLKLQPIQNIMPPTTFARQPVDPLLPISPKFGTFQF